MTDTPELLSPPTFPSYDIDSGVVETAVRNAVAATDPTVVGEHGLAFLVPDGYTLTRLDRRELSDPTVPHHRAGHFKFVGIESIAHYVNRYKTDDTIGYIRDLNGAGTSVLCGDVPIADFILDDHPTTATAFRDHKATLVLRPTAAARRWGQALSIASLGQDGLLDLVVDGIAEIATPDGATLRDLVADLHAIRTTSARSVIRTGGQATVETADNVTLHGGTGNQVTIPENITVTFQPYAGIDTTIVLVIAIKPRIGTDEKVKFTLEAPGLDAQIAQTLTTVRAELDEWTEITPLWVP